MSTKKSTWFDTPNSGFGYAGKFYLKVFQSLQQDERMALDAEIPPMKTRWFLHDDKLEKWLSLVDYQASYPQAFTFSAPAGVWALMRVLEDIGISFSRIMHMSSRLLLLKKTGFEANQHYSTTVNYLGAIPHSKKAVLIRFQSTVRDVTGHDVMILEDELYVAGLEEEFVSNLKKPEQSRPKRPTQSELINKPGADSIQMKIGRSMGQKYGKLSGDLNPLHISNIGAKLFGHRRSFVQGLCTLNLVIAQLGTQWRGSIRSIEIHFVRPVEQPSKPRLLCDLDTFELIDKDGKLLVAGKYVCG